MLCSKGQVCSLPLKEILKIGLSLKPHSQISYLVDGSSLGEGNGLLTSQFRQHNAPFSHQLKGLAINLEIMKPF